MANATSGMAVNDDCKIKFSELKAKKAFRFIVFKIIEEQKVVVEKLGARDSTYENLCASLPANECRYAIYDFEFVTEDKCKKSKIIIIAWSPETAQVRSKMIYASSNEKFKTEIDGIQIDLQATDPTEMSLEEFRTRST